MRATNPNFSFENQGEVKAEPEDTNPFIADTDAETEKVDNIVDDSVSETETIGAQIANVIETTGTIEDVATSTESLCAIYAHLAAIESQHKTISVESASLLQISYDNAVRKFPAFMATKNRIPSMEAFELDAGRQQTVSLETIGGKIKSGIAALVKFVKELIAKIKALWDRFRDNAGNVLSQANDIKSKISSLYDDDSKRRQSPKVTLPALLVTPRLDTESSRRLTNLVTMVTDNAFSGITTLLTKETVTGDEVEQAVRKIAERYKAASGKQYLGGFSLNMSKTIPEFASVSADKDAEIDMPNKKQIESYLDQNIALLNAIIKGEASQRDRAKSLEQLVKKLESMKDTKGQQVSDIRKAISALNGFQRFEAQLIGRALGTARSINALCEKSFAGLGQRTLGGASAKAA